MNAVLGALGVLGFVLCLLMIGFGVFMPRPRDISAVKKTWRLILFHGIVVFFAVWIWLGSILPLLAWMLWIGDNEHWFYNSSIYIAAAIASAFAGLVIFRVVKNRASVRYVRMYFWCSIILLVISATIWSYDLVEPIEGTAPKAAAESFLRRSGRFYSKLVEDQQPSIDFPDRSRCKTYWIMGEEEPKGRITVRHYGWFWWSYAGSERFSPSAEQLQRAKERLQSSQDQDGAILILKSIINDYPNTPASKEARELLRKHGEK